MEADASWLDEPAQEITTDEDVFDVDPDKEVISATYDITSYGADYPVDGLVKRLDQKDVVIPSFDPVFDDSEEVQGFQRRFVWTRPQMDKFVESLLLGLPVPGVFLVREKTNRLLVLDGQQRLRTLQSFYRGVHAGREYRLKQVQEQFYDKTYAELDDEDRRRLDDSIIHATVLRQDHPAGSQDAVYSIFERLNTGGSPLQPQEIRVALFNGPFLRTIAELNDDVDWRALYGPPSSRFKDHELILRVLALFEKPEDYGRPVKSYLNHYLQANQDRTDVEALSDLFTDTTAVINDSIGERAFRPVRSLNAAVLDAVMVGTMRRLDEHGSVDDDDEMRGAYEELIGNKDFQAATTSSTAAEDAVAVRLRLATEAFADVT
ncbi:DUF262 domain-containing protein [Terrabacter sp. LjRoot27]|uniref:DUF262 domain-containing protein n=1 Tax=Terrabacter sp. LjRoot27 TaxID=3342306 RepID=UPI003ED14420